MPTPAAGSRARWLSCATILLGVGAAGPGDTVFVDGGT